MEVVVDLAGQRALQLVVLQRNVGKVDGHRIVGRALAHVADVVYLELHLLNLSKVDAREAEPTILIGEAAVGEEGVIGVVVRAVGECEAEELACGGFFQSVGGKQLSDAILIVAQGDLKLLRRGYVDELTGVELSFVRVRRIVARKGVVGVFKGLLGIGVVVDVGVFLRECFKCVGVFLVSGDRVSGPDEGFGDLGVRLDENTEDQKAVDEEDEQDDRPREDAFDKALFLFRLFEIFFRVVLVFHAFCPFLLGFSYILTQFIHFFKFFSHIPRKTYEAVVKNHSKCYEIF